MLNNISEKVSQLDGEAIQNYRFRVKLLFIFSLLCYIILAVITVTNNHKFIMVILTLIILAIFIGYSFVDNAITKGTNMILTDKCFPDKYLKALEQTSPYTQGNMGSTHSALKNIHHLNKSYALIVEGEFDEGLELLKELEPERFNEFQKKQLFSIHYYLSFLATVSQGSSYNINEFLLPLQQMEKQEKIDKTLYGKRIKSIKAIDDILDKKVSNYYFDSADATNHLEKIIFTYYRAQNELLQGNKNKAKSIFQTIATENPELFYVREAKQYLEEN